MTSSPPPPTPADRYLFLVEGLDPGDALLRLLGLICVQQAQVLEARFQRAGDRFEAKLRIGGLSAQRAEHLGRRLGQLPVVDSMSFGWCEA